MTWTSDFDEQWRTFVNVVQTRFRRQCDGGRCDGAALGAIIAAERSKWADSSHHNGAWLRKLAREHQRVGESFEHALRELRIDPPLKALAGGRAPWLVLLVAAVLAMLALAALWALGLAWWKQVLGAVAAAILAASATGGWLAKRRQKQIDLSIRELRACLEHEGNRLRRVVAQADDVDQTGAPIRAR